MRDTWDMALFGLRLGDNPKAMITTTPKPVSLVRELLKDKRTAVSTGSTFDNAANLAANFLETVRERYEGTRLGRQELYAEILDEAEGALWSRSMIEQAKMQGDPPDAARIVVAVDPAITATEESDETGIIVAQKNRDGFYTVLKDYSGRYKPREWAKTVVAAFYEFGADRIVAEGNQGGDMVRHTIHVEWPEAPVTIVHASRGKAARAEPISALYEQGRVKHANGLQTLEDQLVTWEPLSGMPSPDRLDALVWALTELAITRQTRSTTKTVKGLL